MRTASDYVSDARYTDKWILCDGLNGLRSAFTPLDEVLPGKWIAWDESVTEAYILGEYAVKQTIAESREVSLTDDPPFQPEAQA